MRLPKSLKISIIIIFVLFLAIFSFFNPHFDLVKTQQKSNFKNSEILVIVLTTESSILSRGDALWNTWGKELQIIFACNCTNIEKVKEMKMNGDSIPDELKPFEKMSHLPIMNLNIQEDYNKMGVKVFLALQEAYNGFKKKAKWFFLVDDDTYVFSKNLIKFTNTQNENENKIFGFKWNIEIDGGYIGGGAGMLFTNETMRLLTEKISKKECDPNASMYGDVTIGYCAFKAGVKPVYPFDALGRPYFHPHDFKTHYKGILPSSLSDSGAHNKKIGKECCSLDSITFHYVQHADMYAMHANKNYLEDMLV
jgi:hypothetical protein